MQLSSIWTLLAASEDPRLLGSAASFKAPLLKAVSWMADNPGKLFRSQSDVPHCWTFFSTAAYGKRKKVPQGCCTCRKVVITEPSTMRTRRSRTGGDLEGCDSEIVQLEPVNVKWLDGLGKEDGLLSPESRGRCPLNPCRGLFRFLCRVMGRELTDVHMDKKSNGVVPNSNDASCDKVHVAPKISEDSVDAKDYKIGATKAGNFDSGNKQQAARGQQHMLPASACCACCTRNGSSAQQPARAGSVACARSARWHRLLAQQTARASLVHFRRRGDGWFGVGGRLASEQWRRFLEMAAGEERKKNMDLGFHGFYHGDWKHNLFNILTAKGCKYVLTQPCPPEPSLYDYRNQREPYEKWCEANKMAKRYILASISVELHKKHRSMETATEIMASLHQMFGQNIHFAREAALKRITDTKMEEGTKVRDHVLKMMDYLNEVEIYGVQINDKSKINMVIESLPDTFKEFKKNFIIAENFLKKDSLQGLSRKTRMSKQELGSTNCPLKEVASQKASVTNVDRMVTGRKIVLRLLKSEAPNGVKPIGCKWIYKRKRGVDGRVETFKARLVVEGFTQKEGINYEETFSPVAMLKSIRILLSIVAVLDYEIWQMDVKIAFLNGHLEENIYMQQPDGFIQKGQEHMLLRDRKNKTLALSQAVYIDKILARFSMENSKTGLLPFRHGITFSKDQSPKTSEEIDRMRRVPCAEAVGSLMYVMLYTRPDICFAVGMVSRYQSNPGPEHWTAVKHIMKKSTSGYVFTLGSGAISWMSVKQSCITDSTTKAEYVATSEAAKEAIWLRKFLRNLELVPVVTAPLKLFCDNGGAVAQSKEPRNHKKQNILKGSVIL
ncbi:hypothetical protein KPL71_024234 [Citrus sinensis]|uniref:Uncharacterized protein n=1 Tax=Citrus sinensis TaxID=2711 RepID=A0ACB8IPT6_CITSI|nr:hypothetical protein KPL71_024234 [Citrus sinensis]